MNPNEIPLRLSYLNVTFKGLTYGAPDPQNLTDQDLLKMYAEAKQAAKQPLEKIMSDAREEFGENIASLLLHENYYGELKMLEVSKLCFDTGHASNGLFRGIPIQRGENLTEFYSKHKTFFNTHFPILVREHENGFEVVEGNHRVFSSIELGNTTIPAIIEQKTELPHSLKQLP